MYYLMLSARLTFYEGRKTTCTPVYCLFGPLACWLPITLRRHIPQMNSRFTISLLFPLLVFSCGGGFERFVPPSNSISGRGAKVPPHIIATTPTDGATVAPIPGSTGTQIKVVFDMTMQTGGTPIINTYFRDLDSNGAIVWLSAANSGATFSWSSTNVGDDTLTIQLGWVRWPENNVIAFDFNNNSLVNLDSIPLDNSKKFSFTVQWDTGRYKTVVTGQHQCYHVYNDISDTDRHNSWREQQGCLAGPIGVPVGSYNYPAGQNGFVDPRNVTYGLNTLGHRFNPNSHPQNIGSLGTMTGICTGKATDKCYPYTVDTVTTLVWKTCTEGQYYEDPGGGGDKCTPGSGTDFTYGNAINACSSLNSANSGQGYGGRKDWRLPTVQELEGLINYGAKTMSGSPGLFEAPLIHGYTLDGSDYPNSSGPFPNTPTSKGYWTATGASGTVSGTLVYFNGFVVEFKTGGVSPIGSAGALVESARATTNRKKVRCVAGPTALPSQPSFTVSEYQVGTQLPTTTSATFTGDTSASFNVISAVPSYDVQANKYYLTVNFNQAPDATPAQTTTNYCIVLAATTACPGIIAVNQATVSGNSVKLETGTQTAGTAYKVIVTGTLAGVTTGTGATALTTARALFTGFASPTIDVLSATSPNTSQVQVTFNKLPTPSEATNIANYCIASGTASPYNCSVPTATVTAASLSGYTVTLTASLTAGTAYAVFVTGVTYQGAQVVKDNDNNLLWKRCRLGVFDNSTCGDDGVTTNDTLQWNDGLNNCFALNAQNYAGYNSGWRAPTINELKSIGNRALYKNLGYSLDISTFPSPFISTSMGLIPGVMVEDYGSSTNVVFNGDQLAATAPSNNLFWAYNYVAGIPSFAEKDKFSTPAGLKPQKKNYRCVRTLP